MKMSVSSKHWPSCYEVWMGNHIGHTMSVSQLHLWTWLWFPPLWYHSDNNCVQSDACLNFQDFLWENHFLDKNLLLSTSNFYLKIQLGRKGNSKRFFYGFLLLFQNEAWNGTKHGRCRTSHMCQDWARKSVVAVSRFCLYHNRLLGDKSI